MLAGGQNQENYTMIRFPATVIFGLTFLGSTAAMVPTAPVGIQQASPQAPGAADISVISRSLETSGEPLPMKKPLST
jgi:hypothetical protein